MTKELRGGFKPVFLATIPLFLLLFGCASEVTEKGDGVKPYSSHLEQRVANKLQGENMELNSKRDYLPAAMFVNLPEMPDDFYGMRTLMRTNQIKDLKKVGEEYWQQPEWFPMFEETGLAVLQNPPENRWGSQGYMVYPADSVSVAEPGQTVLMSFWIKSGYLVETYQGINFGVSFPKSAKIVTGQRLVDGSNGVEQNSSVSQYFETNIGPKMFILEPNFPVYSRNGTRRVDVEVRVSEDTPEGNYVVAFDTVNVPEEQQEEWLMEYKNLYISGGMTKIDRPYYQAFITVRDSD